MTESSYPYDPAIVKSYDIRGVYGRQFDERLAYRLGRALVRVEECATAVVGHDARLGSPELFAALVAGLREESVRVTPLGLCPTECVYYAAGTAPGADMGIMVTASHNPPEYNGFKVVGAGVAPITGETGLSEAVRLAAELDDPHAGPYPDPGRTTDVVGAFVEYVLQGEGVPELAGLRLVVDASNGCGALFWRHLETLLDADVVLINGTPDGRFPGHAPDPTKSENLAELVANVRSEGAGLGLCYDGDADRIVAVLPDGRVLGGSQTAACLLEHLSGRPGYARFGLGQCVSRTTWDLCAARGLDCVMLPVGHSKIKRLMRCDHSIAFAAESAGHYYYRDFHFCDSALITTLHLLHMAAGDELVRFVDSLPGEWVSPSNLAPLRAETPAEAIALARRLLLQVASEQPGQREISCEVDARILRHCDAEAIEKADGARIDYDDWWVAVRPSGTEPIVRLTLEADGQARLAEVLEHLPDEFRTAASD